MALTGGKLDTGGNFEQYQYSVDVGNRETVCKTRQALEKVLGQEIGEGKRDETELQNLITKLTSKRKELSDKWQAKTTTSGFNFENNTDLDRYYRSYLYKDIDFNNHQTHSRLKGKPGMKNPTDTEKKTTTDLLTNTVQSIQYLLLNQDGTLDRGTDFFPNFSHTGTYGEEYIKFDKNKIGDIPSYSNELIGNNNNQISGKDNELYISELLDSDTTIDNAIKTILKRYLLYITISQRIISEDYASKDLLIEINGNIKDIQEQIGYIKGIYNINKQLNRLTPEKTQLEALNNNLGNISLGDQDLDSPRSNIIDLKTTFEKNLSNPIGSYIIKDSNIEISQAGTKYPVTLSEGGTEQSEITINNAESKTIDIQIEMSTGHKVKIGELFLNNNNKRINFTFDDISTIKSTAATLGITPFPDPFELDFNIPIQGVQDVNGGAKDAKVALTKSLTGKTKVTATTPPPAPTPATPTPPTPPAPGGPTPTLPTGIEIKASLSDMGNIKEGLLKEKFEQEAAAELREEYNNLSRYNLLGRLNYFTRQKVLLDQKVKEKIKKLGNDVFSSDANLNEQLGNATNRHQLEEYLGASDVQKVEIKLDARHQVFLNQISGTFLKDGDEDKFQKAFNKFLKDNFYNKAKNQYNIPTPTGTTTTENVEHIGTNLLLQLKQKRARFKLVNGIKTKLDALYPSTGTGTGSLTDIQNDIQKYTKEYGDLAKDIVNLYKKITTTSTAGSIEVMDLKRYIDHQIACNNIAETNTKVSLQLLTKGKEAYHIDNSDRESRISKLAMKMKERPKATFFISSVGGLVTALLTGGAGIPIYAGAMTGMSTFVRNHGDLTEQEKKFSEKLSNDYEAAKEECDKLQEIIDNTSKRNVFKLRKLKRQQKLYETTIRNVNLNSTQDLINNLESLIQKINLDPTEQDALKEYLQIAWAKIKFHKEKGHNTLYSSTKEQAEEDVNKLLILLNAGCDKLGIDNSHFETETLYKTTFEDNEKEYNTATKKFERTRMVRAITNGALMAALAGGTSYVLNNLSFGKDQAPVSQINASGDNPITGNVNLGLHDLADGSNAISQGVDNAFNSIPAGTDLSGATIDLQYGAGTDLTQYIPGRAPTMVDLTNKINSITSTINGTGLSTNQQNAFINALNDIKSSVDAGAGYTNEYLQAMRQAEFLDQVVKSLPTDLPSDVTINIAHNPAFDIAGRTAHDAASRVIQGSIHISRDAIDGSQAFNYGKYIAGLPGWGFWNTVKKDPDKEK